MKKRLLNAALCICSIASFAQGQGNIWAFGSQAGLDFNSGGPVAITTSFQSYGEGNATVCNSAGQLLFYTEGSIVWDRSGNIMPNGGNLTGLPIAPNNTTPTGSCTQGAVIVPIPDTAGKYYIFSLSEAEEQTKAGDLYYSVVDMTLNGGLGDIEPGRKGILFDSFLSEKMTATPGRHCDIWLVTRSLQNASFKAYEITNAGINFTPVISNTNAFSPGNYQIGVMKISPDGKKIISANTYTGLELCNFDPATGIASNAAPLGYDSYYGASFSPDNSKVYCGNYSVDSLYQFDVSSSVTTTIIASRISVGPGGYSDLKIGPDGKIYDATGGVIESPNTVGTACNYLFPSYQLVSGTEFTNGLPNQVAIVPKDTLSPTHQSVSVCFQDSSTIYANDSGWDYHWDDNSIQTHRAVYSNGNYVVHYFTSPCSYHTDTFSVTFSGHIPLIGAVKAEGQNNGKAWAHPLPGDATNYTYTWMDTTQVLQNHSSTTGDTLYDLSPGIYHVIVHTPDNCETNLQVIVTYDTVIAGFQVDTVACLYTQVPFQNTSSSAQFTWYWYFGDSTTDDQLSPLHSYSVPSNYNVVLVAASSTPCYDTASHNVHVLDFTNFVSFTASTNSICTGQSINFSPTYAPRTTSLSWNFGDGYSLDSWQPSHPFENAGTVIVNVVAHNELCPDTSYSDTISIFPNPLVNIGTDTALCPGSEALTIYNHIPQYGATNNEWSTGDTSANLILTSPGLYWLTVTSTAGCSTTDSILVRQDCYLDIPNVFTPNGDGLNDYFFPRTLLADGLTSFKMDIYNRWGEVIFETTNIDGRGWDGKFNGAAQPSGVFVYIIDATFKNGAVEHHTGNVTLLR